MGLSLNIGTAKLSGAYCVLLFVTVYLFGAARHLATPVGGKAGVGRGDQGGAEHQGGGSRTTSPRRSWQGRQKSARVRRHHLCHLHHMITSCLTCALADVRLWHSSTRLV